MTVILIILNYIFIFYAPTTRVFSLSHWHSELQWESRREIENPWSKPQCIEEQLDWCSESEVCVQLNQMLISILCFCYKAMMTPKNDVLCCQRTNLFYRMLNPSVWFCFLLFIWWTKHFYMQFLFCWTGVMLWVYDILTKFTKCCLKDDMYQTTVTF